MSGRKHRFSPSLPATVVMLNEVKHLDALTTLSEDTGAVKGD
jgi:hypothetical protein